MIEGRTVEEVFTAVTFGPTDRDELAEFVPGALERVRDYLQRWGAAADGQPFLRALDDEVEVGFPAATPVGGEGDIEPSELPAGSVAVALAEGPDLSSVLVELDDWIAEQGGAATEPYWEVLLDGTFDGRRHVVQPYATT